MKNNLWRCQRGSQGQQKNILLTKPLKLPPLSLLLSLSYWHTGILYWGPFLTFQPITSLFPPSPALRLPSSSHWQGLYGFSDKPDLLFLLFFSLIFLLPVIFSSFCLFFPLIASPSTPPFSLPLSYSPLPILIPLFLLFLHDYYPMHFCNYLSSSAKFFPLLHLNPFFHIFPSSLSSSKTDGHLSLFISVFFFTAQWGWVRRWNGQSKVTVRFSCFFVIRGRRQRKGDRELKGGLNLYLLPCCLSAASRVTNYRWQIRQDQQQQLSFEISFSE